MKKRRQFENGSLIPKIDVLVYHEKCSDGISAAWIVKKYTSVMETLACKAGSSIDTEYSGKVILFVDICPPVENITQLALKNRIIIMDHHKSAKDGFDKYGLPGGVEFIFDINRSGCQIVYDNFFEPIDMSYEFKQENNGNDEKVAKFKRPWFIEYIGDRDLWTWKLPYSKYINIAIFHNSEINFDGLDRLMNNNDNELLDRLTDRGRVIDEIQMKELEFEESRSVVAKMVVDDDEYTVRLATTIPYLRSDLGNRLANKIIIDATGTKRLPDFSAVWTYDISSCEWWVSLRGHNQSPDLSVLSKKLGGGGHPKASGFTIDGKLQKKTCKCKKCDCKQDLNDYFKVVSAWWKD